MVAVAEQVLAPSDVGVDVEVPSGERRQPAQDPLAPTVDVTAVDERRGEQRAGVDHGVRRPSRAALELDRVEGLARRFDADEVQRVATGVEQGQREEERLDRRLHVEGNVGLGARADGAVRQHQREPAEIRVGRRELRDAVVDLAAVHRQHEVAQRVEVVGAGVDGSAHTAMLSGPRARPAAGHGRPAAPGGVRTSAGTRPRRRRAAARALRPGAGVRPGRSRRRPGRARPHGHVPPTPGPAAAMPA